MGKKSIGNFKICIALVLILLVALLLFAVVSCVGFFIGSLFIVLWLLLLPVLLYRWVAKTNKK